MLNKLFKIISISYIFWRRSVALILIMVIVKDNFALTQK